MSLLVRDRRALPEVVQDRLAKAGVLDRDPWSVVQRGARLEARVREVRATANDDGTIRLAGYATSYERPYAVYGGSASGWGWEEVMAAGSWDKTIRERQDIRLLVNHEGVPLARFRGVDQSTMTLTSDDVGVLVDVPALDSGSPLVQTLRSAMLRGDLDQMSCAFAVTKQQWSPDYNERRILEVVGYDVSVVTYPANEDTLALITSSPPPAEPRAGISLALAAAQADATRARGAATLHAVREISASR